MNITNYYVCGDCDVTWFLEDCQGEHDDKCPKCNGAYTPTESKHHDCQHQEHEDCLICTECGCCREDVDEDDVCMDCGGIDHNEVV